MQFHLFFKSVDFSHYTNLRENLCLFLFWVLVSNKPVGWVALIRNYFVDPSREILNMTRHFLMKVENMNQLKLGKIE